MTTITAVTTGLVERPVPREWHAGCGKRLRGNGSLERRDRAPGLLHQLRVVGCPDILDADRRHQAPRRRP
jgi:hypothetical protein